MVRFWCDSAACERNDGLHESHEAMLLGSGYFIRRRTSKAPSATTPAAASQPGPGLLEVGWDTGREDEPDVEESSKPVSPEVGEVVGPLEVELEVGDVVGPPEVVVVVLLPPPPLPGGGPMAKV